MNDQILDVGLFTHVGSEHILLFIKLISNASIDKIIAFSPASNNQMRLAIKLRAPPHKSEANKALLKFLAKQLRLPKSSFELVAGFSARHKTIQINENLQMLISFLQRLLQGEQI